MAHFYGKLQGRGRERTIQGNKSTGLTAYAASFDGAIQVDLTYDESTGKDRVIIRQIPWQGKGKQRILYKGILGLNPFLIRSQLRTLQEQACLPKR